MTEDETKDEERVSCFRCDSTHHKGELKLFGYLCDSCLDAVKELVRACAPENGDFTPGGTWIYEFKKPEGEVAFWIMYNPNDVTEIKEIATKLQRNLVPVNGWAVQMPHGVGYLMTVGTFYDEAIPWLLKQIASRPLHDDKNMDYIRTQAPTNFDAKRIVTEMTDRQMKMSKILSERIVGKPCENKLEMTIYEVGEITDYAADLIKAKLPPVDIIEMVLSKFYVSDPLTRKAAFIGSLCSSAADIETELKDAGLIPQEW